MRVVDKFVCLESGDRLSRAAFEARYRQRADIPKAELVEGVVYVASPLRYRSHGQPHSALALWLGTYWVATPGVAVADNTTVRLDERNEVQPDLLLRLDETCGGQSRISADDYVEGPPELIAEIATSSAAYDLHDKKEVYRRCGVKEYLVWIPVEGTLQWFGLENAMYVCKEPDAQGVIKSRVFPGLWLAVTALTARDMVVVLQVLQMGLQSPEHRAFVDALGQYQCRHST